jgi:hypothetical protein
MAPNKLTLAFAAGSILLSQLLSYGPVLAETSQLIKVQDNSAVYLVSGTQRHAFPLLNIYKSWYGLTFESVKTVSAAELASYMLGKNVLFKKGSLIKIQTDPKVYQVLTDDGALEWIPSEEEFKKRGLSFADVKDVPDSLFSDYRHAVASDFATPQNTPSEKPTSPNTSTPELPKPSLSISGIKLSSYAATGAGAEAELRFSTSIPATAEFSYTAANNGTTVITLESAQTFSKKFSVVSGISYTYSLTATAADGSKKTETGSFVSYADISVNPIAQLVPAGTLVTQPEILVGGFVVKNESSAQRTSNLVALQFDTGATATSQVTKTLYIVRLNADNSRGDVIAEKTIPSGTSMTNASSVQNIAIDETYAPGESKRYGIVLKNLDQINKDLVSPSDTFVPLVSRIDFLGETSINLNKSPLATLVYVK